MFEIVDSAPQNAVIKVIGVGGGGGNAVQHMVSNDVKGVDFIAVNTDAQALDGLGAERTLQIGSSITKGLGAGANPETGRAAAIEDRERLADFSAARIWSLLLRAWVEAPAPEQHPWLRRLPRNWASSPSLWSPNRSNLSAAQNC